MSFERSDWRRLRAFGPSTSSSPMCETSNAPASSRTARCSWITPSYWTGISQPANGTIRAPRATWRSCSGVRRRVCTGRDATPAGELAVAQEGGHVEHLGRDVEPVTALPCDRGFRDAHAFALALALRPALLPVALPEPGGDHGDAHLVAHRRVDHGAEDDHRVL